MAKVACLSPLSFEAIANPFTAYATSHGTFLSPVVFLTSFHSNVVDCFCLFTSVFSTKLSTPLHTASLSTCFVNSKKENRKTKTCTRHKSETISTGNKTEK